MREEAAILIEQQTLGALEQQDPPRVAVRASATVTASRKRPGIFDEMLQNGIGLEQIGVWAKAAAKPRAGQPGRRVIAADEVQPPSGRCRIGQIADGQGTSRRQVAFDGLPEADPATAMPILRPVPARRSG